MKIFFASLLIILISITGMGQNLVPNPSFEEYNTCPDQGFTTIESAENWINPTAYSPDYYNACANISNPNYSVPTNWCGQQNAKTGNAYAGIYLPIAAGNNLREYIQNQLSISMLAGEKYMIKFYVSPSENSEYSVNSIGIYLSNMAISSSNNQVLEVNPQIVNSNTNPLIDKNIWYEISGVYTAFGGEKFITIGNFEYDEDTDTTSVLGGTTSGESYYYIDDVSVELYSDVGIGEYSNNILTIYPNPSDKILNIEINEFGIYDIRIVDILGKETIYKNINHNQSLNLDLYSNGVYMLQLIKENKLLITRKIIINH